MQELVISILLTVVIIMAAVLLIFVGSRKDGMTKKTKGYDDPYIGQRRNLTGTSGCFSRDV